MLVHAFVDFVGQLYPTLNDKRIKLYAPDPWKPGSSYAHFDDDTYDGGEDALMTAAGAKIPDLTVGPRLVGVLKDLGWTATPAKR